MANTTTPYSCHAIRLYVPQSILTPYYHTTPYSCPSHLDIPQSNSPFAIPMHNWLPPHFPDNYRRERDNNEREYYAGLQWEWEYCMNESNSLHNDLLLLGAPLVDRVLLTMPRGDMDQCRWAVTKIWKENNPMFLCRCKYHLLQLAEEHAVTVSSAIRTTCQNEYLCTTSPS